MTIRFATILFSLFFPAISAFAQPQLPPPIDWPVQNIQQETPVWCWVAVAQQIILARVGPQKTPPQCALVAIANQWHPQACCGQYNPNCVKTGSTPQIQFLIQQFGLSHTSYAPPAAPMVLYNTLNSGRVIILQVQTGQTQYHVVVLRGMYFEMTPNGMEPILIINDPMAYYTQPVPYSQIVQAWRSAIVVQPSPNW